MIPAGSVPQGRHLNAFEVVQPASDGADQGCGASAIAVEADIGAEPKPILVALLSRGLENDSLVVDAEQFVAPQVG